MLKLLRPLKKLKALLHNIKATFYGFYFERKYKRNIRRIKLKKTIKVAFIVSSISQWKSQSIYSEFEKHNRYDPVVYVVPENTNEPDASSELYNTLRIFIENNVNAIDAFSSKHVISIEYKNIKKSDIVFFSRRTKWNGPLSLKKLVNCLNCYVPYSIHIDLNNQLQYGTLFHQCLWSHFLPCQDFYDIANQIYPAKNCHVKGYPGLDPFTDHELILKDKKSPEWGQNKNLKIIWAPHHSIEDGSGWPFFSTFLLYAQNMLNLLNQSNSKYEICFKPHPALKSKLFAHPAWGENKTIDYYEKWKISPNGHLHESIYHDLFLTADVMILDSVSFITEFASLKKPLCFLTRQDKGDYSKFFNLVGRNTFHKIDKADSWKSILSFIGNKYSEKIMRNNQYQADLSSPFQINSQFAMHDLDLPGTKIVAHVDSFLR